jgi:hypothetical protein
VGTGAVARLAGTDDASGSIERACGIVDAVRDILCREWTPRSTRLIGDDLVRSGILDRRNGAIQIVGIDNGLRDIARADNGSRFGEDAPHRVMAPGSCAGAIAHRGSTALRIGVGQGGWSGRAARRSDAMIRVRDRGRGYARVACLRKTIESVIGESNRLGQRRRGYLIGTGCNLRQRVAVVVVGVGNLSGLGVRFVLRLLSLWMLSRILSV